MRIATGSFRGETPRLTARALPDNAAQDATNARLLTGDASAWQQLLLTQLLERDPPVNTIAFIGSPEDGAWMSFEGDVDVARGIIPGDTTYRTYLTGPEFDVPQWTNLAMAATGAGIPPIETRPVGVPGPDAAPTLTVAPDPNATTLNIDVLDEGDQFATWTVQSPGTPGGYTSICEESASVGHPAPSYTLHSANNNFTEGVQCFMHKDFGTTGCTVIRTVFDVYMASDVTSGYGSFYAGVQCTEAGAGIYVGGDVTGLLYLNLGSSWSVHGATMLKSEGSLSIVRDVWYTCEVNNITNADGTQTITATLYLGSAEIASISVTGSFAQGTRVGFVAGTTEDSRRYYDNILVQATGSTGYVPVNTATSYVYTFVNDLGEESAPSFASVTVLRPTGVAITVTTSTSPPSGFSTEYGVTTKRIYRAVNGATGTQFQFVAEIPLAQADYVDVIPDTELGEALESTDWDLPPDDLLGILALPNGVMVGFRRNQICFSAQNHPHAWPVNYRLNTDTDVVGIGNIDTAVVIVTKSFPYVAVGSDPANYSMAKFEVPQAGVSKRSIAYLTAIGVVFASPDGFLAVAGVGQIRNLTETIFTREQWQALDPTTILAIAHDDVCHFFYDDGTLKAGFALDMKSSGFGLVPLAYHAIAAYSDPVTDNLYVVLDADNEPTDDLLPLASTAPSINFPIDPYFSDNQYLLHCNGADGGLVFTDVMGHTFTNVGGDTITTETDNKRFGSAALSSSGSDGKIRNADGRTVALGWTIEGWAYLPATDPIPGGGGFDIIRLSNSGVGAAVRIGYESNVSPHVGHWVAVTQGGTLLATTFVEYDSMPGIGGWNHVALSSDGTTTRFFIAGEMIGSVDYAGSPFTSNQADIGEGIRGEIRLDEIRVTNAARYTEDFTPPAAPFPGDGNIDALAGNVIFQFNADDTSNMVYRWKSKLYVLPAPLAFFRVQVKAETFVNMVFRLYKQVYSPVYGVWQDILVRELVVESEEPFRLNGAQDYTRCWWEILSTDVVQSVQVTQGVEELE